jgi:hypothetical protein
LLRRSSTASKYPFKSSRGPATIFVSTCNKSLPWEV